MRTKRVRVLTTLFMTIKLWLHFWIGVKEALKRKSAGLMNTCHPSRWLHIRPKMLVDRKRKSRFFNRKRKLLTPPIGKNCSDITTNNIKRMLAKQWARVNVCEELSTMEMLQPEEKKWMTVHGKTTCPITIQTSPCPQTKKMVEMMIISTKGTIPIMDVVVAVMTKKKKTDLCPLCWPELEATSKFWDSMPGKENLSTTRLCVMVCPLKMPSIPNGWSGISGASLRNSSEPMSVFS